ncbi:MAG TPA: hypothetical protein VGG62_17790 [Terracidiphilus sp.]|jgi:hypothetical protein
MAAPSPPPPISQATLDALNMAIATGVRVVRFQDRTVEYPTIDEMIKAANYINQLLNPSGSGSYRQIRCYTNKGL